jgi:hypothetical protein
MAGLWTHRRYDKCDKPSLVHITEGEGKYRTDLRQLDANPLCIKHETPTNARVGHNDYDNIRNINTITDIESHLLTLNVPLGQCLPTTKQLAKEAEKINKKYKIADKLCSRDLISINSKLDIPTNIFRDITFSRFDFPIIPPEEFVFYGIDGTYQQNNNRFGVNTKLVSRDNIGLYNKPIVY